MSIATICRFRVVVAVLLIVSCDAANENSWAEHGLNVQPENRCSTYDSGDYRYSQSVETQIVTAQGGIFSPYDLQCFATTRDTDIDHIVARSEAHDSGLCGTTAATRKQFATDLLNLTLASPSLNRHLKAAKDAAEWLPDENQCWYAHTIILVKRKYSLSVDQAESDALKRVLNRCENAEMIIPQCAGPASL